MSSTVGHRVHATDGPGAIAVSAQIRRNDVMIASEIARHPIPGVCVIAPAVHQQERRRASFPQSR